MRQHPFNLGPEEVFETVGSLGTASPTTGCPTPAQLSAGEPEVELPNRTEWTRAGALQQLKLALQVDVPPQLMPALPRPDKESANAAAMVAKRSAFCIPAARYTPAKTLAELFDHCEALSLLLPAEFARGGGESCVLSSDQIAVLRLLENEKNDMATAQELSTRALIASSEVRHWAAKGKPELSAALRTGPGMPFPTEDSLDELLHRLTVFSTKVCSTHRLATRMNQLLDRCEAIAPLMDAALAAQDRLETADSFSSERLETALDDLEKCVEGMKTQVQRSREAFSANASALRSRLEVNPTFATTSIPFAMV